MVSKFKDFHNRAMSRHSQMFDTTLSITYTEGTKTKSFTIKCTVNSLTDQEKSSGGYDVSTVDFTLRYDDIRASEERTLKTKDCIIRGYKGKYVKYDGTTYKVEQENPNGSTKDCVVLRCVIYNGTN